METKLQYSEAARQMRRRFAKRGAAAAFARRNRIDPGVVSRWASGQRKPTAEYRDLIEEDLGINRRLWTRPPRRSAA